MSEPVLVSDLVSASDRTPASFDARRRTLWGCPVVEVAGALVRDTAPRLRSVLFDAVLTAPLVVVDMAAVSEVDAPGAGALALVSHVASKMDKQVLVAAASGRVRSQLAAIGTDPLLRHHRSPAAAVQAGRASSPRTGTVPHGG